MTASSSAPRYGDLLEKGPCKDTERVYKMCAKEYKKLKALCVPAPLQPSDVDLKDCILLSDNPPLAGIPPGRSDLGRVEETQQELWRAYNELRASVRAAGGRAGEFHLKLVSQPRRVCQRPACKVEVVHFDTG